MADRDQQPESWSEGAAGYEASFAPYTALYVDEVLDRLGVGAGTVLLDVAAGPGTVSLRAAARGADVLATDFAPGMVEVLRARLHQAGHLRARADVMDGQALDLPDDSADAGVSMFGVIFFPDADAGMRELARVVRPGGGVAVGSWNLERFRLTDLVHRALTRGLPELDIPPPAPRWAPLGRATSLAEQLARHLDDVEVHTLLRRWRIPDPAAFFRALPGWSPTTQPLFQLLDATQIDRAVDAFVAVVHESGGLPGDEGMPVEALVGTGVARDGAAGRGS